MEKLLGELNALGVKLWLDGSQLRVAAPQGVITGELAESIRLHKDSLLHFLQTKNASASPPLIAEPDLVHRFEPFPITDLQHAYWVGRDSSMEIGNVATHFYIELDCPGLDVARANEALRCLIDRHEALRIVINRDGTQRILSSPPAYQIAIDDQSASDNADQAIENTRQVLSHQVLNTERWPLFDIRATLLPASRVRLHVSLDLLIFDARSILLFFREWHARYMHPAATLPEMGFSFRDYVLAEKTQENTEAYRRAKAYWLARVATLPEAPALPLRAELSARKSPHFSRRAGRLEKARWQQLKDRARTHRLTPSALLIAAYSAVLARWSEAPHFTLNLTFSERLPVHKDIDGVLGNFTSVVMLEVDYRDREQNFATFAARLHGQLMEDLQHRRFSGVKVIQQWAKHRGISLQAAMPVVFSSGLSSVENEFDGLEQFGKEVFSLSQTSQVWLHNHVVEVNGDLAFYWDAVDGVFENDVLDRMFEAFSDLLEQAADDTTLWQRRDVIALPEAMLDRRETTNATPQPMPQRALHAGLVAQAQRDPEALAVISTARSISYGELLSESAAVADWLIRSGAPVGRPVAVLMRKGWEQVVAVYGALLAGCAYMPIDADLPAKRQAELLRIGEATHVLIQPNVERHALFGASYEVLEISAGARAEYRAIHARSLTPSKDQLAYMIFTSGTTGTPKGVMIDHFAAMNTIEHVNRLIGATENDRVLAVSSLSFDLSVYDIFGLHDAGGALVLPDYRDERDPHHWRRLMTQHGVTLWNSAPPLMRMLMDSFSPSQIEHCPLKAALLSGDFIPLDLPAHIRQRYGSVDVIGLGGATEASIWSNYYRVEDVDPNWTSIPYGKALPNQTIAVYDHALRPCPDYVKGKIFIGGAGLAKGYWKDAEKTRARFIVHPQTGERLYDTGDLGRYAPDGNVVILGRDDSQIKIRGHRVELGEIEAVLRRHLDVKEAVVMPVGETSENRRVVAYVEVANGDANGALSSVSADQALKHYLTDLLPVYMIPHHIVLVDRIPISSNGKIDYKALPAIDENDGDLRLTRVAPRDETERIIMNACLRVMGGIEIGVTDNFFDIGFDSLMTISLAREINAALSFDLEMHELFQNMTVESLASLFKTRSGKSINEQSSIAVDNDTIRADIQEAVSRLAPMAFHPVNAKSISEPQAVLLTGGTGWVGAHLLSELLSRTRATIYCLIRGSSKAEAHQRLINALRQYGIDMDISSIARVEVVCGDLSQPDLGMHESEWRRLESAVDAIYHAGASVNVLTNYAMHREVNVRSLVPLLRLASTNKTKPIFFMSPMAVCRRFVNGRMVIQREEGAQPNLDGLLTGYAQSKWAAETILLEAVKHGATVKIYRTSHALPSTLSGLAKSRDTYGSILQAACKAGVVPNWKDSALHGVPVDILSHLIIENSLQSDTDARVVHIENQTPQSLPEVIEAMLEPAWNDREAIAVVAFDEWKARCIDVANDLSEEDAVLVKALFTQRGGGAAVDHMFSSYRIDTSHFENRGQSSALCNLTSAAYWRKVCRDAGWGGHSH